MEVWLHREEFYASTSCMSSSHHQGTWAELSAWFRQEPPFRVVICDIYGTLLTVQNPAQPADAALNTRLAELVREEHAQAQRPFPEVDWIALWGRCFPEISSRALLARLARKHARRQRHCALAEGAAAFIRTFTVPLALCSNAQAYTLMELRLALRAAGLRLATFDLDRSFFSYQAGTSKPNPAIFQQLAELWSGPTEELLMVGDRLDNDIQPAREAGWSTWHLTGAIFPGPPTSVPNTSPACQTPRLPAGPLA